MFYKSEDRLSNLRDNVHQRSSSSSIPNVNNRNAEYSSYQSPPTRIRSHAPLVPSTTSAFAVPKPNYNIGNRSFRDDKSHEDSYDLVKKHLETVNLGHLFETLKREEVDFDAFKLMTWKAFHNMGIKTDEEKEKLVHLIGILNIGKNTNDKIY
uniref:SAM domain-containing protein n=1 Tax=Rhabditophanes sp. KR3021 TaxID=114890 RepID=A0AC35UB30_9BILA